jgi:hypothetical protein
MRVLLPGFLSGVAGATFGIVEDYSLLAIVALYVGAGA